MEINVQNFEQQFELLKQSITTSEFITFDTEFTGSKIVIEDKPHEYDTFQDKYRKNKIGIEKFCVVQVGLTTFMWSNLKQKYIGRPFNILVFPRSVVGEGHLSGSQITDFHVNADTIGFLNRHCFDFNNVFHHGIPYTQLSKKGELMKKCQEFILKIYDHSNSDKQKETFIQKMSLQNQAKMIGLVKQIDQFLTSKERGTDNQEVELSYDGRSMTLQIESVQLRQNISRELHRKYGFDKFSLSFDTDPENSEFIVTKIKDEISEPPKYDTSIQQPENPEQMQFVRNEETGKIDQITSKSKAAHLEQLIKHESESLFEYELGFSRIVELIIKAKKPLVGHNMFLDIMYLYQQFIADLPDTLEEFIHNFSFYFPDFYDTKAMGECLGFFTNTTLNAMSSKCFNDKKFNNYLQFDYDLNQGFNKYLSKASLHEAGYDSYITGVAYASMVKQLEIQTFIEFQKIRGRTGGMGVTVAQQQQESTQESAGFRSGGKIINSGEGILSCRTGVDINVPLPDAKNLVEIANSKLTIGCAKEFSNYVMLAMEGQRCFRFVPEYAQSEEITDHKNVIFIELDKNLSAFEFGQVMCNYGDVYVIKDSQFRYFVEFQWVDDVTNPDVKTSADICNKIISDNLFGEYEAKNSHGVTVKENNLKQCLPFMEALRYRGGIK